MNKKFEDMGIIEMAKTLGEMGNELQAENGKTKKCECRTFSWNREGDSIEYCRLHECAEELVDAIKTALDCIGERDEKYPYVQKMKRVIAKLSCNAKSPEVRS